MLGGPGNAGASGVAAPSVSVLPVNPKLSVACDSFCFLIVVLFSFVCCKKWDSNLVLLRSQWGRGGNTLYRPGPAFSLPRGRVEESDLPDEPEHPGFPSPSLPRPLPPTQLTSVLPECSTVSRDDACSYVWHQTNIAERGHRSGVQLNVLLKGTRPDRPHSTCRSGSPASLAREHACPFSPARPPHSDSRCKRAT